MLQITIPKNEGWSEADEQFIIFEGQTLLMEHSLLSISKWEAKWQKPYLTKERKTPEEAMDYIKCMTITKNVSPLAYNFLTNKNIKQINDYIEAPMTATTIKEKKTNSTKRRQQLTSELIYYYMISFGIPLECEKWHLNRLFTLIRVCEAENSVNKPLSTSELMRRNAPINAARRKKLNSRG